MCRLFAGIATEVHNWKNELVAFSRLATCGLSAPHSDGWGIGWYQAPASPEERPVPCLHSATHRWSPSTHVIKEPKSALNDERFDQTASRVTSHITLAHVRKATVGAHTVENSQPFFDAPFIFAHNGEIDYEHAKERLLPEWLAKVRGQSDSELYAYLIFQELSAGRDITFAVGIVKSHIAKKDHTCLNFVMSDGQRVYAFCYASEEVLRKRREEAMKGMPGMEHYYTIYYASLSEPERILVCSEKLADIASDADWQEVQIGELLSIDSSLKPRIEKIA